LCEASLELLKLDVVECLVRSSFYFVHGGKSLPFSFFVVGDKKKHRDLGPVNRVGGERLPIPERQKYRVTDKAV
jgi:hypothetical protein